MKTKNQKDFKHEVKKFKKQVDSYADHLIIAFDSNAKARAFLNYQLWETNDIDESKFINLMVAKLERIALNK